ncbi:hypothetical protein EJ04DRAFT_7451 [Polyplosphaeria fusca]|uniref:Clr5 domain-containing protein n=1 Tax=Polyplosphaeria fusca TaxID=682080 RepID=A0A9P4R8B0_9PLEO|nr:hypothetical protein EJ04DRAFT_7451 [Polyplosphaeria fusca]
MSQQTPIRFVDPPPRAARIPPQKWEEHREELCSLYQRMKLDDLMRVMKVRHGFEPSKHQYTYQFDQWNKKTAPNTADRFKKYNTMGRPAPPQEQLSTSGPARLETRFPLAPTAAPPPKRPKSMGSLQSSGSRSSLDKPAVPPKKRQKLDAYMASRSPFADPVPHVVARPSRPPTSHPAPTLNRLATAGLQFASTGHPSSSLSSPLTQPATSPGAALSSTIGARTVTFDTTRRTDDNDLFTSTERGDAEPLLSHTDRNVSLRSLEKMPSMSLSIRSNKRRFDSSRPIHMFSQEELADMKMAANFLRSLGFDSDAFELFTILLKQLKDSNQEPTWKTSVALSSVARSAFSSSQVEIARTELEKTFYGPREASSDVEFFLYRMLFAETCTNANEKDEEEWNNEIAIGCEMLTNDKMLDHLPAEHRMFDILTYHYLLKCLEYLNAFVQDSSDKGTIFTDKEHLQIRLLERIPGPFELRHGSMGNPCLRSCLHWCDLELRSMLAVDESWKSLEANNRHCMYWASHIGLYCALWQRWESQRRGFFGNPLPLWMLEAETRMGITSAELLSITCGLIMDSAPTRNSAGSNQINRARAGAHVVCRLSDMALGRKFLDTYSLLGSLLGSAPQKRFHDGPSFVFTLLNSTRERAAFSERARTFARSFIETDLNIILPEVQQDPGLMTRRSSQRLSFVLSDSARNGMEHIAATMFPPLAESIHSSELSAMRCIRDHFQQAARGSLDMQMAQPSAVTRLADRSMSDLSQALSSMSITSTQQAANGMYDAIAASFNDFCEFFAVDEDPFRDGCGPVGDGLSH